MKPALATVPAASQEPGTRTPRHLWDYWRIIWEGRYILAITIGGTFLVAIIGTLMLPKRYRAESLVEIDLRPVTVLDTASERGLRTGFIEQDRQMKTEFLKIKSRELIGQAIEQHDLRTKIPDLGRVKDPVGTLSRLTKVDPVSQTTVARISVSWTDPEVSTVLTNAITATYADWDLEERRKTLRQRAAKLQQTAQEKNTARRDQLRYELAVLDSKPGAEEVLSLPDFKEQTALVDLSEQLGSAERELRRRQQTYGWAHESVREQTAERDKVQAQFDAQAGAVRRTVEQALVALGGDPADVGRPEDYTRSQQEAAETRIAETLTEKVEEQDVLSLLLEPKAKVIDPALPPGRPYSPNLWLNLALALVVGTGFGGGLVFFRDYLDVSVKTIDDVERDLGLPLLAVVPTGEGVSDRVVREAFQTLRTGLLFASAGRRSRVLLVTSTAPREGKSTVLAQLARSIAAAGESVVVVDGDLRRPSAARLLGVPGDKGLSNYLADASQKEWRPFAKQAAEKLMVIPAGPIPPNPVDLLGLPKFADLLRQLAASHDWVLLDSPPVSSVTDGVVLASLAEMVLIVVRHDQTDKEVIRRALSRLQGVGANVIGAVLNAVDMSRAYNRDFYYGRYFYGQYYGDEPDSQTPVSAWRKLWRRA